MELNMRRGTCGNCGVDTTPILEASPEHICDVGGCPMLTPALAQAREDARVIDGVKYYRHQGQVRRHDDNCIIDNPAMLFIILPYFDAALSQPQPASPVVDSGPAGDGDAGNPADEVKQAEHPTEPGVAKSGGGVTSSSDPTPMDVRQGGNGGSSDGGSSDGGGSDGGGSQ